MRDRRAVYAVYAVYGVYAVYAAYAVYAVCAVCEVKAAGKNPALILKNNKRINPKWPGRSDGKKTSETITRGAFWRQIWTPVKTSKSGDPKGPDLAIQKDRISSLEFRRTMQDPLREGFRV